jgi:ABC-type multidrug transport system permease subunit
MAALTLVGTAITSVLLVVLVLALARGIDWRSNEIFEPTSGSGVLQSLAGNPIVWTLAFLAVSLGSTALALLVTGAFGEVALPGGAAIGIAPFALLVLFFLVAGTYAAVRERRVSPAGATLAAALVVATLTLVAIATRLLMGP